eukprot:1084628-Prymnesium_polylepis.1
MDDARVPRLEPQIDVRLTIGQCQIGCHLLIKLGVKNDFSGNKDAPMAHRPQATAVSALALGQ